MEWLGDFWGWVVAVFEHWHGWLSGGILAFALEVSDRIWDWKPNKKFFAGFLIAGLIFSFFFAWRDQRHEANEAKHKLDELTNSKFELSHGTSIVGDQKVIVAGKTVAENTHVFLPVTIFNKGAPSVMRNCQMTIRLSSGEELRGVPYSPPGPTFAMNMANGQKFEFSVNKLLAKKATEVPIPTGGQADGFVFFLFPPGLKAKILEKGSVLVLTVEDINKKKPQ